MVTAYVKNLLQTEVITAITTATSFESGVLVRAYESELFDRREHIDPSVFPCAVVHTPEVESSETLSENFARLNYRIPIALYVSNADASGVEDDIGHYVNLMQTRLAYHHTANMRLMGIFPNGFTKTSEAWAQRGQDVCYMVEFSVACHVPLTQQITTA